MPAPARAAHTAPEGAAHPPHHYLQGPLRSPSPRPSDACHGPSGPSQGPRSTGLSAAGKESKRPRDESTPPRQRAAATKPNLPDSDPAEVQRRWQRRCLPQRSLTSPRQVPSPGDRRGGLEPSGLSREDAKGLGQRQQRRSDASCGAVPAPTPSRTASRARRRRSSPAAQGPGPGSGH